MGIQLDTRSRRSIADHVRLLLAWNAAINLTAIREPAEIARLHVLDSLAAVRVLRERGILDFADLGSGGGFPGIPLAIGLGTSRGLLVESVRKKAAFLDAAVAVAGLQGRLAVAAVRAESLATTADRAAWPAITARAVAGLADLIELAMPLLRPGGSLIAWKGSGLEDELAAATRAAEGLGAAPPEAVAAPVPGAAGHRLVVVRKLGPTPPGYPRDPATRRRRPW